MKAPALQLTLAVTLIRTAATNLQKNQFDISGKH